MPGAGGSTESLRGSEGQGAPPQWAHGEHGALGLLRDPRGLCSGKGRAPDLWSPVPSDTVFPPQPPNCFPALLSAVGAAGGVNAACTDSVPGASFSPALSLQEDYAEAEADASKGTARGSRQGPAAVCHLPRQPGARQGLCDRSLALLQPLKPTAGTRRRCSAEARLCRSWAAWTRLSATCRGASAWSPRTRPSRRPCVPWGAACMRR